MVWVVEGNLASLAPDRPIGQIGFSNLAKTLLFQSGKNSWLLCNLALSLVACERMPKF